VWFQRYPVGQTDTQTDRQTDATDATDNNASPSLPRAKYKDKKRQNMTECKFHC